MDDSTNSGREKFYFCSAELGEAEGSCVNYYLDRSNRCRSAADQCFHPRCLPGSPAFRAGLLLGDRIVRIQGIEARNLSYKEIMRVLDGTLKVEIMVERNGHTLLFVLLGESLATISERIRSLWSPANQPPRQRVATLGGA